MLAACGLVEQSAASTCQAGLPPVRPAFTPTPDPSAADQRAPAATTGQGRGAKSGQNTAGAVSLPATATQPFIAASLTATDVLMVEPPRRGRWSSWLASFVVHFALIVALALWSFSAVAPGARRPLTLEVGSNAGIDAVDDLAKLRLSAEVGARPEQPPSPTLVVDAPADLVDALAPLTPVVPSGVPADGGVRQENLLASVNATAGGGLEGRGAEAKVRLLQEGGGTRDSEDAVARGLRWLQSHQLADGSWRFDLHDGPCQGVCSHSGSERSTTAATALALLPFLGAGHTHTAGQHQETVRMAIYYLVNHMRDTPHGGDLTEGTMYAQGLAAIALCEAYALSHDPALETAAQRAIDFVVYAQDKSGGGWRYAPGQPGDTTVTGWQLMALKSAQMAYLRFPRDATDGAGRYLDGVASEAGAFYGYQSAERTPTNTAVGLLCRMYSGWDRERPALARGVAYLAREGPSESDMYFNYYATQVLRHWGQSEWDIWNERMRDFLVESQSSAGHESGSWFFEHKHSQAGGRLYNTALAIMILEVYYRHLPLYREESVLYDF